MRLTRTTAWVGGAVLLALVATAATWLLLVGPRQQLAADLREQATSTAAQNDVLEAQVRRLEIQLGDVPQTRAEVAALREELPADADLATLLRQVTDLAGRSGATLTAVTPSEPAASASPEAAAAPTTEGAPAPPPAAAVPGLQVVPVTVTATGSFAQAHELLRLVQVDLPRAVLVRSVALSSDGAEEADGLQLTITADAFVLPPTPQEEQLAAMAGQGTTAEGTTAEGTTADGTTAEGATGESPADGGGSAGDVPAAPAPAPATTSPTTPDGPVPATPAAPLAAAAPPTPQETL